MEADVLQGAAKTIKQFKPAIYYKAVFDEEANILSPKTQAAAKFVKKMNYDQYWHFSRRFVDDNYFGNTDNVFGDTSDLCVAVTRALLYVPSALRRRTLNRTHTLKIPVPGTSSLFLQEALRSRALRSWKCPRIDACDCCGCATAILCETTR
jgi:hypothetical protein